MNGSNFCYAEVERLASGRRWTWSGVARGGSCEGVMSMDMRLESGQRFGVRSVYTLAGEWGTGSHPLALPSIDVSRQSTGLGKTMRLKVSKSHKRVR